MNRLCPPRPTPLRGADAPRPPRRARRGLTLGLALGVALGAVGLVLAAPQEARAQFNCGEPGCLELQVEQDGQPASVADVARNVVARASYQFQPGTYTDVTLTITGPAYFLGAVADPGSNWQRTCHGLVDGEIDPLLAAPYPATWQAMCVFTFVANGGVLDVTSQVTGFTLMEFRPQHYSTPIDYDATFSAALHYDLASQSYERQDHRTVRMHSEPHIRTVLDWRSHLGMQQVSDEQGDPVLARAFRERLYVRNQDPGTSAHGTRALVGAEIRYELPAFVRFQGLDTQSGPLEAWRIGADNTASVGQQGGLLHLVFDGLDEDDQPLWWPLGVSNLMTAWNEAGVRDTTWVSSSFESTRLWFHWSVDCDHLPLAFHDDAGVEPTTPVGSEATTDDGPGSPVVTHTIDRLRRDWVASGSQGSNDACDLTYEPGGTTKRGQVGGTERPPHTYPQEGDRIRWRVDVVPPSGIFELGPTTVLDKIPPFQHLHQVPLASEGWTSYACRFDNSDGSRWFRDSAPDANPPTAGWPYYGLDQHYFFDTHDGLIDPDTFHPHEGLWEWDDVTRTGCLTAPDVCAFDRVNLTYIAPDPDSARCAGMRLMADEATHVVWSTVSPSGDVASNQWVHPTEPGVLPPPALSTSVYVIVGDLSQVPDAEGGRVTVQNEIVIGGGAFDNPGCDDHPWPQLDLAWLNRTCRSTELDDATQTFPIIPCPDLCYFDNAQPGDLPDHATRRSFAHMDPTLVVRPEIRSNVQTVPIHLPEDEPAVVSFAWIGRSDSASIPNPRFTITLPIGFQPRPHDYDQDLAESLQPVTWPGAEAYPELRYVGADRTNNIPTIRELLDAGVTLDVTRYQIDADGDGAPDSYRYEIEFVPDDVEATFRLRRGWFVSDHANNPSVFRGYFQVAVEPSSDYPYVAGEAYPASFEISDAHHPRDADPDDVQLAFETQTTTHDLFVVMAAELDLTAGPTCRPDSARPSYLVTLTAAGVALEQAEGVFVVPSDHGLFFEGAAHLANPALTAQRVIEVTMAPDLDTALLDGGGSVVWTALAGVDPSDYASVTGVRLRFLEGATDRLPAYESDAFRVDLDKAPLTLADIGAQFTTRGWTRAGGITALPYAQSDPLGINTIGMCPTSVTVVKRFDDDGDGSPDPGETPLPGWTFDLVPSAGASLQPAELLLDPDGTDAAAPHAPQVATTGDDGTVTFLAWPGQTYELTERLPEPTDPYGPTWSLAGQDPQPGAAPWQAEFDARHHAFANTCACSDDYMCGGDDRCVAPGVCEFGQPLGAAPELGPDPVLCEPFRFYAVVEDADGAFVGTVLCTLDDSFAPAPPEIRCDADDNGVLNVDTTRNACLPEDPAP